MTVFHDYTQLIRISQRRITAAWHELANESVLVTPRVAREAAEGIIPWDLERSIRRWQEDLQDPSAAVTDEERMITRVKLWWATQWQQPGGLYQLRVGQQESCDRPDVRRARRHLRRPAAGHRPHAPAPDARERHRRLSEEAFDTAVENLDELCEALYGATRP